MAASSTPPNATAKAPARAELPASTRVRFRDGDVDALAEVYDRYARPVWSVAMTVTHADHLAQEVVQEAFLRAWSAAPTYDADRDLGPWILTIARYTALDLLRRELRPTRGGHEAEHDGDSVVDPPDLDRAWISWAVREAMRELNENEREIVRLSFYEDLTHAQIAESLGLPLGTVKSRSHRAHRRLAELLDHLRDSPDDLPADGNLPGSGSRTHDGTKSPRQRRDDG